MSQEEQLSKMLGLIESKGNLKADFFVLPETAIGRVWENDFYQSQSIRRITKFMQQYPNSSIILGASTRYLYPKGESSKTSKPYWPNTSLQYDTYNTAIQISKNEELQKYHKSKLVIGVEMMPYPVISNAFVNSNIINLGGSTNNLGTQEKRSVFSNLKNNAKVAPVICYESIYGEFVTGYMREGANVIFIITNDGWWGDTPGYRQHLSYAKLRAIENRKSIVRCANTGVSAIINQKGEIEKQTEYWVEDVLNGEVNLNPQLTYFATNGDFIGRISRFFSLLLLLSVSISSIRKNK
jgi:apolipoprotein N-acyltransferase